MTWKFTYVSVNYIILFRNLTCSMNSQTHPHLTFLLGYNMPNREFLIPYLLSDLCLLWLMATLFNQWLKPNTKIWVGHDPSPRPGQWLLFCLWIRSMRSPKWSGGYFNFQCNGIIAVTPGGRILPSGTETPRLHSIVIRTEIKYFSSRSLGYCNSEWVPLPFPWLDSWTCEPCIWKKWQCMVVSESNAHSILENAAPALQGT